MLYTTAQAAETLKTTEYHIRNLIRSGHLKDYGQQREGKRHEARLSSTELLMFMKKTTAINRRGIMIYLTGAEPPEMIAPTNGQPSVGPSLLPTLPPSPPVSPHQVPRPARSEETAVARTNNLILARVNQIAADVRALKKAWNLE